jgi:hypothetical protein
MIYFLLITIAILNYSFIEKHYAFTKLYRTMINQYEKEKKKSNDYQHNKFICLTTSHTKKENKTANKINFHPLLQHGKIEQKQLFIIFTQLLSTLMKDRINIYHDPIALADKIIITSQQNPKAPLETLVMDNDNMQHTLYQILKESPKLADFATFSSKASKKKIDFYQAKPQILIALFGEKIATIIMQNKKNIKSEQDLRNLVTINGFQEEYPFKLLCFPSHKLLAK